MGKLHMALAVVLCAGIASAAPITVEPDDYPDGTDLTHIVPEVTLTCVDDVQSRYPAVKIESDADVLGYASTGRKVFAYAGIMYWLWPMQLRMDFNVPVTEVSIDYIAADYPETDRGRLQIFNADDQLLGEYWTDHLSNWDVERMTLSRPAGDIAYALATSDPVEGAEAFGRLDNLSFVPEPATLGLLALGGLAALRRRR